MALGQEAVSATAAAPGWDLATEPALAPLRTRPKRRSAGSRAGPRGSNLSFVLKLAFSSQPSAFSISVQTDSRELKAEKSPPHRFRERSDPFPYFVCDFRAALYSLFGEVSRFVFPIVEGVARIFIAPLQVFAHLLARFRRIK